MSVSEMLNLRADYLIYMFGAVLHPMSPGHNIAPNLLSQRQLLVGIHRNIMDATLRTALSSLQLLRRTIFGEVIYIVYNPYAGRQKRSSPQPSF